MRIGSNYESGRWLVPLFLLVGVLAPTICVLWFLNVAVNNQRDASRRKLSEAYRGQLVLLRDSADGLWEKRMVELGAAATGAESAAVFEQIVTRGLADSAVCDGYPSSHASAETEGGSPSNEWLAARSLEGWKDFRGAAAAYAEIARGARDTAVAAGAQQARIRCLVRAGEKTAAVRAIEESFLNGPLARGRIAADELFLGLQLDPKRQATSRRLAAMLNDYHEPLSSGQRLFLMNELKVNANFPTLDAERLAAQFLESGRTQSGEAAMAPSGIADLWKFTAAGGHVIALYRTSTIVAATRGLTPPGTTISAAAEWIPAGLRLPGWQIALAPSNDDVVDAIARRQTVSYIWIGCLGIAVVAITALVAGQAFQRHWRLARLKTDLVSAVSHELKTPLASTRVLVDSLLEEDSPHPARVRDYLEMIARENLRLSRLIENFLTFSRLERNRRHFEFTEAAPARVVQLAIDAMQERIQMPECRLEVSVSPGLPAIRADEDALVTALLNLLDNAYKYTSGEKRIALRAFGAGRGVVFAVEDNGIGIASGERRKIFRRFYQVDRRLSRETSGCGLGLSIVDFIVKAHGGVVEVESHPGKGSTFSVVLP